MVRSRLVDGLFPLTPTLSLWEREKRDRGCMEQQCNDSKGGCNCLDLAGSAWDWLLNREKFQVRRADVGVQNLRVFGRTRSDWLGAGWRRPEFEQEMAKCGMRSVGTECATEGNESEKSSGCTSLASFASPSAPDVRDSLM